MPQHSGEWYTLRDYAFTVPSIVAPKFSQLLYVVGKSGSSVSVSVDFLLLGDIQFLPSFYRFLWDQGYPSRHFAQTCVEVSV